MKYFKNITDAMTALRPEDKIEFVLNNKFAVVRSIYTDGQFSRPAIAYLHNNLVYFFCISAANAQHRIQYYNSLPNIERTVTCYNHSGNGKPNHYIRKKLDHRPLKKVARKLQRALSSNPITLTDIKFDILDEIYVTTQATKKGLRSIISGHLQFWDDAMFEAAVCDDFGYFEEKMFGDILSAISWMNKRVKELVVEAENESEFAYITDVTTLL